MPEALLQPMSTTTHTSIDMSDLYRTIAEPSEATVTEKRSKFLAFAWPVTSVDEAMGRVGELQRKYYDARHVCYAYMLGADRTVFRANDNGEPSGTAGKPILGQINSLELTDVVVGVVRYFGGIKLGTPGLIAAYRAAARAALDSATVEERHVLRRVDFTYPYASINDAMKLTRMPGVRVADSVYDNVCRLVLDVEADRAAAVVRAVADVAGASLCDDNDLTTNINI